MHKLRAVFRAPNQAAEVLSRLREGNADYVARGGTTLRTSINLEALEQTDPIAAVVMCSDMHAVPEQVFGLSPGELCVMQTAANYVGEGEVAGAALACAHGVELVIVLGHSPCQIAAACEETDEGAFGAAFRELRLSREELCCNGTSLLHPEVQIAQTHASRMAEILRRDLGLDSEIIVVAAYLHGPTGEVEFL